MDGIVRVDREFLRTTDFLCTMYNRKTILYDEKKTVQ